MSHSTHTRSKHRLHLYTLGVRASAYTNTQESLIYTKKNKTGSSLVTKCVLVAEQKAAAAQDCEQKAAAAAAAAAAAGDAAAAAQSLSKIRATRRFGPT